MTTFGTYNILHETYPSASPAYQSTESRAWSYRSAQVAQNIVSSGQDAVGVQEVSHQAFTELQRHLAAYGYVGEYAQHHGGKPDGVAIFYKKAKFTRLAGCMSGHMSGVRTTTRRNDLYLDLKDNTTGKVTRFATAHIEGNPHDTTQGNTQLGELMTALEQGYYGQNYGVDQIVVGADFNQEHGGERSKMLSSSGYVSAGSSYETEVGCKRVLDGVWVKSRTPVRLQEARLGSTYQTASDHHLLGVTVTPVTPPSMHYHSTSSHHHHHSVSSGHDEKYPAQDYQATHTSTTMQPSFRERLQAQAQSWSVRMPSGSMQRIFDMAEKEERAGMGTLIERVQFHLEGTLGQLSLDDREIADIVDSFMNNVYYPAGGTPPHSHPSAPAMSSGSQLHRRHTASAPMVPRLNVPNGTSFRARLIAEAARSWRVPGNHSDSFYNTVLHEALTRADRAVEQSKTTGKVLDFRSEVENQLFLVLYENGIRTQREIDAISDPFMTIFDHVSRGSQTSAAAAPAHAVSTAQSTELLTGRQMAGLILVLGVLFAFVLIANS